MRPSKIRFLGFSLVLLVFGACGSLLNLEDFHRVPIQKETFALNPYFSETGETHVYNAEISVYGKNFSGTFVHKKMNDTLQRAAFLSGFGNTLLDLSFNKDYFKLNYGIKEIDKKYIVTTLVEDFRLMTIPVRKVAEIYENPTKKVLKTATGKGFVYYFFDKKTQRLVKLVKTSARKKKVSVYFSNFNGERPRTIKIAHHGLKLTISLNAKPKAYVD
ncbi:MAG TPA: hypothetical protein VFM65_09765 [Flavobacteriaceae bacterium]|nr:hypothetical protein [Flavobacteriaceae bacterium]